MERRKIEELVLKYELEPTLIDIFVEGDSDICILNTYINHNNISNAEVFEIETIDISSDYLAAHNLDNNNRGRVIALSNILLSKISNLATALCIIDKDLDSILEKDWSNSNLIYTDYSCMEMYVFDLYAIQKFMSINFSKFPISTNSLLHELSQILKELFLIRCANEELGLSLSSINFLKLCKIDKSFNIIFDKDGYIDRYLTKNNKIRLKSILISNIEKNRKKIVDDDRFYMHGHDFIKLMLWYIYELKPQKNTTHYNEDTLWKACFLCLDLNKLIKYNLFNKIDSLKASN